MRSIIFCYIAFFVFFVNRKIVISSSLVLLFLLEFQINHLMNFFGTVAEKSLEITDKTIYVSFSGSLQNDILVIVIPETRRKRKIIRAVTLLLEFVNKCKGLIVVIFS